MSWREAIIWLILAYAIGALFVLLIAIPIGINMDLYENTYTQAVAETMLAYLLGITGITIGLAILDLLE